MKGVKHYKKDGTLFTGNSHKMPNGDLHSNKSHTKMLITGSKNNQELPKIVFLN